MRSHPGDPVPQDSARGGDYAVATPNLVAVWRPLLEAPEKYGQDKKPGRRRRVRHSGRRRMRLLGRLVLVVMWGIAVAGVVMFLLNGRQI